MKYADDLSIPIWMFVVLTVIVILMRQEHDEGVSTWVDRVLCAPNVICSIVHVQDLVEMYAIAFKAQHVMLNRREGILIAIIGTTCET